MDKFSTAIYEEKYKPKTVDELVIPQSMKDSLKKNIENGTLPHLGLFSSSPGTGKSSTAKAIINDMGCEALWINASLETGVDVLRGKIAKFCSAATFDNRHKIIVMDEFDRFGIQGQSAFRGFIDEFSYNCRFIFTGNYKESVHPAVLDRIECYDYNSFTNDEIIHPMFHYLKNILEKEGFQWTKDDLIEIIKANKPSIRGMVNDIQRCRSTKVLVPISTMNTDEYQSIFTKLKSENFDSIRQRVFGLDTTDGFFSWAIRSPVISNLPPEKMVRVTAILADGQYKDYFVRDKHLNLIGVLAQIKQVL